MHQSQAPSSANPSQAPLLATKLFAPRPRAGQVARPRLVAQLDAALQGALTLVSAPAGFGKTTLLVEWQASPGRQKATLAWLSLDAEDGEPTRFWTYFIAALQTAKPGLGEGALALLRSPQVPPAAVFLPPLVNELAALADDLVVVLDDYHLVDSPAVHEALASILERLPPRLHLAVLTRADPPWPLARWRARGLLAELRAADLRFMPEEAVAYLCEGVGLSLAASDVAALYGRTEGWIVGLQLAALSLRGRGDATEFVRSFAGTNRFVLDFLVEEVLSRQAEAVQAFLLRTSVLDRLSAPLCDAVLGKAESAQMLETLERTNLFLVPLDEERSWYRYHHLFADLLRAKLRQGEVELVATLHARAAEWCAQAGLVGEAMGYALAAGDHERAAQLAEGSAQEMFRRSDPGFMPLVARLPYDVVRRRPWLVAYRATLDIVWGRWDDACRLLAEAQAAVEANETLPDGDQLRPFLRAAATYLAEQEGLGGDFAPAAEIALAAVPRSRLALWNTLSHWQGISRFLRGDFPGAEEALLLSIEEGLRTDATNSLAGNVVALVKMRVAGGRLRQAADLCRHRLGWMEERGRWRFFRVGDLAIGLGEVHREWNDPEEALALIEQGLSDNQAWPVPNSLVYGHVAKARVLAALGQPEAALALLQRLEGQLAGARVMPDLESELNACWVNLNLSLGNTTAAARRVPEGLLDGAGPLAFRTERDAISLVRLLLARGEADRALALLGRLAEGARCGGRTGRLVEILTLEALGRRAQNELPRALAVLSQALVLGEPEGYCRLFVDGGAPVAELLAQLDRLPAQAPERARVSPAYLARLRAALGAPATPGATPTNVPPLTNAGPTPRRPLPLVEPLSERELEVLRLLAAGLTNEQICRRLVLALGTVKAHVHHISAKLDAQNRAHAVARARELNLI